MVLDGQEPARDVPVPALGQSDQERGVGVGLDVVREVRDLAVLEEFGEDYVAHRHGQGAVGARGGGQPVVGELRVVGVVGGDDGDLLALIAGLGHEMGVRGPGDGQVRSPDDQVGGVPPVAGLGHVGLVAEHLGGGDRHVGVPVVEGQDRSADQGQEPGAGGVGHHGHRRDGGEAHDAVRAVFPGRVDVGGGDQLRRLLPGGADEAALAPGPLVLGGFLGVLGDRRPRLDGVFVGLFRFAPEPEQLASYIRVFHPGRRVGVPGERGAPRAAAGLVLRGVRAG